jgi:hypothetical protein
MFVGRIIVSRHLSKETPMIRAIALFACLLPAIALAQSDHEHHGGSQGSHHQMMMGDEHHSGQPAPAQAGQAAFAAIQEIAGILEADPKTDWSKVDIEALRQHLIDMNNVTLAADVKSEPIEGGMRFTVTGPGSVRDSIRRMVVAHAATMNGIDGWDFEPSEIEGGATLTVRSPAADATKLRGLGFIGVMTRGMHHQMHHLMIAKGEHPHH